MKNIFAYCIFFTICLPIFAEELSGEISDFTLKSVSGENIRLNELRGQVVMINFWATWCGPCRQEMPELEKLYQKYKRAGFVILALNNEEDGLTPTKKSKIEDFVKEQSLSFPVLYDNEKIVTSMVERDFLKKQLGKKNMRMPTSIFIDRDGKARFFHESYKSGDEKHYKKLAKALLRE